MNFPDDWEQFFLWAQASDEVFDEQNTKNASHIPMIIRSRTRGKWKADALLISSSCSWLLLNICFILVPNPSPLLYKQLF